MEIDEHVAYLADEGERLGEAAAGADLEAPIPGCPDWSVRGLVQHVGTVHRWAATVVAQAQARPDVEPPVLPSDGELIDWYRAGHANLVQTLRAAPADLECFNFLPAPSPLAFWARRQAMETAIHRADAQGACGAVAPYDDALALDGISELVLGFGARKKSYAPVAIRLAPTGGTPWFVQLSGDGMVASQDDPGASPDVTVSGSPSDVYRWTWNRPSAVTVDGDPAMAAEWHKIAVRWG